MLDMIENLLGQFNAAWSNQDLDAVMACFAEDAVYFASVGPSPGERAEGHTDIRHLVERMFELDGDAATHIDRINILKDAAFWTWRYTRPEHPEEIGCDFFEFGDGLITLKDAYRKTFLLPERQMEPTQ
ncbi:MAG: nuclear transport factor 2 family protein [Pseudomonadota bacterium]